MRVNIEGKLKAWKRKTIQKSELEGLLHTGSDEELYRLITEAVSAGLLSPVKSAGTNGNRVYPISLKYRIETKTDYREVLSEIDLMHPSVKKSGYLQSRPEIYVRYRTELQQLNDYLFRKQATVSVSKKERSFEIFGEEKQLEVRAFCHLLEQLGLGPDALGYYETPEYCFDDYIPKHRDRMVLVILENKDIWFNIRRRMYEDGVHELFGVHIDGIVYGSGNEISKVRALTEYTRFMNAEKVQYLYWGDIDRAGLNIYQSVVRNNPEADIQLFAAAYREMLKLSDNRKLPDSEDGRERIGDYAEIYRLFSDEERERLRELIDGNKRLPQEIIDYEYLLDVMR